MSNREKAKILREELQDKASPNQRQDEQLAKQVEELKERVEQLQGVSESLIENIASLEEENLELKRAMETQGSSLTS